MTPFDSWYSANIAPAHEEILKNVPEPARSAMRQASRESMAACWNACRDVIVPEAEQMRKAVMDYYGENLPAHLKSFLYERLAVIHNARVTP